MSSMGFSWIFHLQISKPSISSPSKPWHWIHLLLLRRGLRHRGRGAAGSVALGVAVRGVTVLHRGCKVTLQRQWYPNRPKFTEFRKLWLHTNSSIFTKFAWCWDVNGCHRSEDALSLFLCATWLVQTDTTVLSNITQMESRRILSGCPPRLWGPTQDGWSRLTNRFLGGFFPTSVLRHAIYRMDFLIQPQKKSHKLIIKSAHTALAVKECLLGCK